MKEDMNYNDAALDNYEAKVLLHGHLFDIDPSGGSLNAYPNNALRQPIGSFFKDDRFVYGWYEGNTRKFYTHDNLGETISGIVKPFKIPRRLFENGPRLTQKEIEQLNRESIDSSFGYIYISKDLANRLKGTLPLIDIDTVSYTIDVEKFEIRQTNNPQVKFELSDQALYKPTELYYNTKTKTPVTIGQRISEYPKDTVVIKFPSLKKLDVVGFSKFVGEPLTNRLCYSHWRLDNDEIRFSELMDSIVPELVRRNQIELEMQGPSFREVSRENGQGKMLKKTRGIVRPNRNIS